MYDFWEMECDRQNILSLWTIFGLLSSLQPRKSKFWKHQNNAWRYYHFTHLYHKWQSYHVWFLKYKAWQTEFFVILDCFLPFYLPNNLKNQNFAKNERNRYYHFTHVYHKYWSFTLYVRLKIHYKARSYKKKKHKKINTYRKSV